MAQVQGRAAVALRRPLASKKLEVIAEPDKPTIVTRRVFDAPRALVFDAWTKPEHLRR